MGRGPAGRRGLLAAGLLLLILGVAAVPAGGQGRTLVIAVPDWALPDEILGLPAFTAETGIEVRRTDEITACAAADLEPGAAPGLLLLHPESPARLRTDALVLPLDTHLADDPELAADLPGLADWRIDGRTLAVPAREMPLLLEVDRRRLADAGIALPPETWDALLEQARVLRATGADPHPVALAPTDWTWALLAVSLGDPLVDAEGRPTFTAPGSPARRAMDLLLTMLREELIAPAIADGDATQHSWFWSGRGTFHQGWAGSLPAARHPSGGRGDAVTYLPLPDGGRSIAIPRGFAIPAGAPDPEAAWTFLRWVLRPEIQRTLFTTTGVIPARRSVADALVAEGAVADGATLRAQLDALGGLPWAEAGWEAMTAGFAERIVTAARDGTGADAVIDALGRAWDDAPPAGCRE